MSNESYIEDKKLKQNHLLEQYKLYVEMADKVSSRRNLSNVFFLTLHTTIFTIIGFVLEKIELVNPKYLLLIPLTAIIILCISWWIILKSYRNLNSAKFSTIKELEKMLPVSPYAEMEWIKLGEGKDIKKYIPLTVLERWVPLIFAFLYFFLGTYLIFFQ